MIDLILTLPAGTLALGALLGAITGFSVRAIEARTIDPTIIYDFTGDDHDDE